MSNKLDWNPAPGGKQTTHPAERQPRFKPDEEIGSAILCALRDGDHLAYEVVFAQYYEPLKKFLITLTRSLHNAEEIVQEVFLNVWVQREKIDPSRSIKRYLYQIARNISIDYYKQDRIREKYAAYIVPIEEDTASSDEAIIARETELLIEIAISRMPPMRRQVYRMSRNENLTNEQISTKLGISKETVASHIYNAVTDIKKVIAISLFFLIS